MPNELQPVGPPWTILKILHWTNGYFKQFGLEQPRMDAELLLAHVLDCRRIDLYLRHDQPLSEAELSAFRRLIKRRAVHEPIAYITGVKEFWSIPFAVSADVLIPRPDTECIVEKTSIQISQARGDSPVKIWELGIGSGAISVALAHEHPNCCIWASDISWPAVVLARQNARTHQVAHRIFFFCSDWFAAIDPLRISFDLIVSNPPYIATDQIAHLASDIRYFEPSTALDGGVSGLICLRHLIQTAHRYLKPLGNLFLEIGYDQMPAVKEIGTSCPAYDQIQFHKDFGGHDRVVQLRRRST